MGERKNQSTLTADEKARFVAAVLQLKANGTYDRYVAEHRDLFFTGIHGSAIFLPWHREFLLRFELDLQSIDPSVTLPYWDWTVDRLPTSSLWRVDFMGGDGDNNDRVTTGPFAFSTGQWNITVTDPILDPGPALRRALGSAGSLPRASQVNASLARTSYTPFNSDLEVFVHNGVHNWVGGSMSAGSAPNDPVFFLHHCNVDRLWAVWQTQHPGVPHFVGGGPGFGLNDPMQPWENEPNPPTPAHVLDHRTLEYTYDTDIVQPTVVDLTIGAPPTQASISLSGEVDWYRFVVPSMGSYTIETEGPTDVVMSLFGPNSQTALVTEDDDSGQDRNARIVSNLTAGTYFLRIQHYNPRATGNYGISVRGAIPQPSIPEIQVNGPEVQGSIDVANESDLYTFTAAVIGLYTIETSGNTDTFLTLYGPNSQTRLIAQDDDSGPGLLSLIVADLTAGVYFVRVRHYSPTGTGAYGLSVSR